VECEVEWGVEWEVEWDVEWEVEWEVEVVDEGGVVVTMLTIMISGVVEVDVWCLEVSSSRPVVEVWWVEVGSSLFVVEVDVW
jgi:hypothetical protein